MAPAAALPPVLGAAPAEQQHKRSSLSQLTPPLSTERLKATRQRTKNAVCSILDQGEVSLEFLRQRSGGVERVVDVCRISGDGMRVNNNQSIIKFQPLNQSIIFLNHKKKDCAVPTEQRARSGAR